MGFWSGRRLLDEGSAIDLVDPFDEQMIDCSAYTLTLGGEAYVTPHFGNSGPGLKQSLNPFETVQIAGQTRRHGGGSVAIPPGQFALLLTQETISIPPASMGFISLKSKPKFGGLINVSGFHVDPGFSGKLIYSVFNAGPSAVHLTRGDPLFLLWLADLSGEVREGEYQKTSAGYSEIPSEFVTRMASENHSLETLSRRVAALSATVTVFSSIAAALAVLFGLLIGWLTWIQPNPFFPKNEAAQTQDATHSTDATPSAGERELSEAQSSGMGQTEGVAE